MYSRNEQYLEACCNKSGTDGLPKPVSRNETLLYRLAEELSKDRLAYSGSRVVVDDGTGIPFVRVSDEVPSWVSMDVPIKYWMSDGNNGQMPAGSYADLGNGSFIAHIVAFITTDNVKFNGLVFPMKGVYFELVSTELYVVGISSADSDTPEITWDGNIEFIKTIDPKYIKDMYYTKTIPGSDGPIVAFQAYINTISPLTLSEPLIVDAPYTVNVGNDKYKTTCTAHGEQLYIIVSVQGSEQGSLIVDDPINNPLVALWQGAVINKWIEIVRESQEEVKQIDQKYIPPTTVMVNIIPNKDGTFSADKTYMEVKELIDNGVDVKCVLENIVIPIVAIRDTAYIFAVESFPNDLVLTVFISDGGCEVEMNSPSDAISDLIDEKLGVIENGSY